MDSTPATEIFQCLACRVQNCVFLVVLREPIQQSVLFIYVNALGILRSFLKNHRWPLPFIIYYSPMDTWNSLSTQQSNIRPHEADKWKIINCKTLHENTIFLWLFAALIADCHPFSFFIHRIRSLVVFLLFYENPIVFKASKFLKRF